MEILNKKQKIIVVVLIIIMCIVIGYYIISKTEKYDYSDIEKISNIIEEDQEVDDNIIEKTDSKYIGFDIEYLSTANKYFPRYKGQYIFYWKTRANYSLEKDISGCEFGTSEEAAKKIIDRYLELQGIGSIIIPIKS